MISDTLGPGIIEKVPEHEATTMKDFEVQFHFFYFE